MIDLHKHWTAKKDLAEKLYKNGIKKRHTELSNELKDKVERTKEKFVLYEGKSNEQLKRIASSAAQTGVTGDELIEKLKTDLKQEAARLQQLIKEESKFPVAFDDGLGKLLDKVYTAFKKGTQDEDEREKDASRAVVVISKYRANISDQVAALAKGDEEIASMLKEALHELEQLVRNWSKNSAPKMDSMIWEDCEMYLDSWEKGKKASQRAHKELPKDAVLYLKSEKYDSYPFKFNRGLGDAVKGFKKISTSSESLPKLKNEVGLAINAYRSDIEDVRKKYKRLISKFERDFEKILEPLEAGLTRVEEGIVDRSKK